MSEIQLEIVTTEENVFSGKVDFVGVKSVDGRLGILPKHVSLITELTDKHLDFRFSILITEDEGIIIGEDEISNGTLVIKNMTNGEQEVVVVDEFINHNN